MTNREETAAKLREVFAELTPEQKMQALLDTLPEVEVIQVPAWILANLGVQVNASKVVISIRKNEFRLEFKASNGGKLEFNGTTLEKVK